MAVPRLHIGDLIRFNQDLNVREDNFKAYKDQLAIVVHKNIRSTRFRVYTSVGTWAEITKYDVEQERIEILASTKKPQK